MCSVLFSFFLGFALSLSQKMFLDADFHLKSLGVVWTRFGFAALAAALAAINLAFALPLVVRPMLTRAGVSRRGDNC